MFKALTALQVRISKLVYGTTRCSISPRNAAEPKRLDSAASDPGPFQHWSSLGSDIYDILGRSWTFGDVTVRQRGCSSTRLFVDAAVRRRGSSGQSWNIPRMQRVF